jgi:predicted CopG family antitoxin
MSFVKRNRIVSIRVTQNEYETLERISREQGANSVSEFLRRVLTNSALANLTAEPEADGVLTQVAALKRKVDWLSNIVEQRHKDSRPE